MRRRLFLSCLTLTLAACGGETPTSSDAPTVTPPPSEALGQCLVLGGSTSLVSSRVSDTCVGCRVDNATNAGDVNLETFSTLHNDASALESASSVRVTQSATEFPAGRTVGAIIRRSQLAGIAGNPFIVLNTYLGGSLQETLPIGSSSGFRTYNLLEPNDLQVISSETTQAFDAVEIALGGPIMVGRMSIDVHEVCSNILEPPISHIPEFASANPNIHWTQQAPPDTMTPAMEQWFEQLEQAADTGAEIWLPTTHHEGSTAAVISMSEDDGFSARIRRSDILDENSFFQINAIDYQGPFVRIYEGNISGDESALVYILLADDFLRGVVRNADGVFLIREGTDGNLPLTLAAGEATEYASNEPISGDPQGCPEDDIPNNHEDLPFFNGGHRFVPPFMDPNYALNGAEEPLLQARIILDADLEAFQRWGRHLPALMIAMQIEQGSTFHYELGVRFSIAGVHMNLLPEYFPTPFDTPETFDYIDAWWGNYKVAERDMVHLHTGRPIAIKMASCIGAAGTAGGYLFTSTADETSDSGFSNINIISHEIGHLFSAHHQYGNHAETAENSAGSATIMIQGYTPGSEPNFSSLSRAIMRGWAKEYLQEAQ